MCRVLRATCRVLRAAFHARACDLNVRAIQVSKEGLTDMYLTNGLYFDEYYNILTHELSVKENRLVARHEFIDVSKVGAFTFGPTAIKVVKMYTEQTKHYPEAVARITSYVTNSPHPLRFLPTREH